MLAELDGREMGSIHVSLRMSGNLSDRRGDKRTAWEHWKALSTLRFYLKFDNHEKLSCFITIKIWQHRYTRSSKSHETPVSTNNQICIAHKNQLCQYRQIWTFQIHEHRKKTNNANQHVLSMSSLTTSINLKTTKSRTSKVFKNMQSRSPSTPSFYNIENSKMLSLANIEHWQT